MVKLGMKQQTGENCSVPIAKINDVRPRWAASTCSQGHPGMVQKKPANFYRENMLAPKFPRYQPCGESLEHNG